MNNSGVILSVVVISHNQCKLLRRCLDSVLSQNVSFPYEIIVSDDNSCDGTREMLETDYKDKVVVTYCNSDDCNPAMTSERASFNRLNGLKYANGKYLIHVDGDDFYYGVTSFEKLVKNLEDNYNCNVAVQNFIWLNERDDITLKSPVFSKDLWLPRVYTAHEFINYFSYCHNSCCCMRRNVNNRNHKFNQYTYDDTDITFQYIGDGCFVVVDSSEFVYCQYDKQTASKFNPVDQRVCWASDLMNIHIAPQLSLTFLQHGLLYFRDLIELSLANVTLEENTKIHLLQRSDFLTQSFLYKKSIFDILRLKFAWLWIRLIKKTNIKHSFYYKILYRLIISCKIPANVILNINK